MQVKMTTNHGDIVIELNQEKAPKTVENFLSYVKESFYDGTVFHRVIPNFMIQGGGFTVDMDQKETKEQIQNEANNGLDNDKGTIAMARTGEPHSATCQFFINTKNNDFLNFQNESPQGWGYCVFGKVVQGMDVVEKIESVETGSFGFHQDVPKETVLIESISLL